MRLIIITFFIGNFLNAQNLVINPGFEDNQMEMACILSMAGADGWTMPSDGSSDYILIDNDIRKQLRKEEPGYARVIPFEGNACAGFLTVQGGYEYICGTLEEPLVKDSTYTISFALARMNNEAFTPERIGIYFSDLVTPYFKNRGMPRITWKPQVTLATAEAGEQRSYWQVYSMTYRAEGGERTFVIGDFTDTYEKNPRLTREATYFYIDSVFIGAAYEKEMQDTTEIVTDTVVVKTEPEIPAADTIIAAGKTLTLENIYFETNKSRILPESYQPLYDIIIELKLQPDLKVEIVGHTDKHGDPKANQKLSEDRAKAVADFFISKGIDASRITTRGEGQSKPVSEEDRKNRRVEFIFTE